MTTPKLTFRVTVVSYGLTENADPKERRLRLGLMVYAKPTANATPPTLNDGDLALEVSIGQAEKKSERQPRFNRTPDAEPDGEPKPNKHRAKLTVKQIGSTIEWWLAEAEVPINFTQQTTPWVTGTLYYKGSVVASSQGRNWKAIGLNPSQTVVRQLTPGSKAFPCFAVQLCSTHRAAVVNDLSAHNYLASGSDYTRLADLTQELFARVNEGVAAIWAAAESSSSGTSLYGDYPLKQREEWAFGTGSTTIPAPEVLGSKEQQQIDVANEVWARAITELVSFSPYYGPGPGYFDGDIRTIVQEDDGDVSIVVRSRVEYDLAEGVSSSPWRGADAFYPLVNACQHLTTLAVLSRGWCLSASSKGKHDTLVETESSINAGSQGAVTFTTMLRNGQAPVPTSWVRGGGTAGETPPNSSGDNLVDWLGDDAVLTSPPASTLVGLAGPNGTKFGPGSISIFSNRSMAGYQTYRLYAPPRTVAQNPAQVAAHENYERWIAAHPGEPVPQGDPTIREAPPDEWAFFPRHLADNTMAAHVGTILRVDPASKCFQVLDTGALNTGSAPGVWSGLSGVHDYPGTTATMSGKDPYRGVGLVPPLDGSSAQALYNHVRDVVQKARPLGLVRLILAKRGFDLNPGTLGDWLLYASPLMRMYGNGDGPGNQATLANLIWSLRDFPKREQVRIIWSVRLPVGPLARAMLAGGRTTSTFQLAGMVMQELLAAATANPHSTVAQERVRLYVNCSDLTTEPPASDVPGRRAWQLKQGQGAPTLATARILSRFTRVAIDLESNADGTVSSICSLNAHGHQGYSGTLPLFHQAELATIQNGNRPATMLSLPLHSASGPMPTTSGAWDPTPQGFAAWVQQVAGMTTANVGRDLLQRFQ
jgi:hypothetical protein